MQVLALLVSFFFSTSVFALYVERALPEGDDVDPGTQISFVFNEDIVNLGPVSSEVKKEQIQKITIEPAVACSWRYEGTKKLTCLPKTKLTPDTSYKVSILDGFPAANVNSRISYRQDRTFKTNKLALRKYSLDWSGTDSLAATITMNYLVKPDNIVGTIQCNEKMVPVKIDLREDKGIQLLSFKVPATSITAPDCVFYFTQPLTLKNFPKTSLPEQRVVLSKTFTQAEGISAIDGLKARCQSLYNISSNLSGNLIPSLGCEFSDKVVIELGGNSTGDVLVQATPKEGVKIEGADGYVYISGFQPGKSYVLNISKAAHKKLKKDIQLLFNALVSPPLMGSKKPFGVMEKDGPWKFPFSTLNITEYNLDYEFLNKPEELANIKNFQIYQDRTYPKHVPVPVKTPANENHLIPMNFQSLAEKNKFTAGVFGGKLSVSKTEDKYQAAENALIKEDWELRNRRSFMFSFLITDIALHFKAGEKGALVWATSMKTGEPISGVDITIYQNGVKKTEGSTNRKGIAEFKDVSRSGGFLSVVAQDGDDISFVSSDDFWSRGISPYDFNLVNYYEEESAAKGIVADVVAERPLYLPGERVELKLFIREASNDGMELRPAGEKYTVTVNDSRGEEVFKTTASLNKYGTLAIGFKTDAKAATGPYAVYATSPNTSASFANAFQVQEFRKPEIKVAMEEDVQSYIGKVTYFSGGEMTDADGEVAVIFKQTPYRPADPKLKNMTFPQEVGGRYYEWESYYETPSYPEVISREEIKTDDKGKFTVAKADVLPSVKKYGYLTVEGIFTDSAGGKVAGRISTLINPYKYIPGIELTEWYYNTGDKVNPRVVAITPQGKPATGVKMAMEVKRITYSYERRLGSGNYFYYDYRTEEKTVKTCKFTTTADFKSCEVVMKDGGTYKFTVQVEGADDLGAATVDTWVMGKDYFSWKVENHDRLDLSVENNGMKLGETFRMMALAPFSDGEALVTFEHDGIIHAEQFSFKGNVVKFEKELDDEKFIPGFYASLVVMKGRSSDKIEGEIDLGRPQFKIGYSRVEVANLPKRLTVDVKPSRPQAKPGEMMEATINVKDYKGRGAASELAIAVVDDALLSLSGNYKANYDVLDTFYSLKKSKVWNYNTLTQLIGRRTYGKKGVNPGGGGGMDVRSDLKNTAYWVAQVETDGSGKYDLKFKLPDNLTTWKIIAVSVDDQHRFGFGEAEFLATKPLTVEPMLPNFLVEGDKFKAQVNVANRSGNEQEIIVAMKATGLTVETPEQKVSLKNGGRTSVNFPMTTGEAGTAEMTMSAVAGKLNDALKVSVPVERNSLAHVSFTNGYLDGKEATHNLTFPADVRKDSINLTVEYSHTALSGLDEVFGYVLGYPYGCWEQRLSKAYFLVQYEAFKDHISYRFPEKEGKIRDAVQKLLDLAPDYQAQNGGMRYYPGMTGDYGESYLSIFTGYSFVLMKKMGYKINAGVEKKLRTYLKTLLTEDKAWNDYYDSDTKSATKALLLTVLTGMGEKNLNASGSKLYAERDSLDLFGLSFLGGYLNGAKGFENEAKNVFGRLESLKVMSGTRMHFKEPVKTNDEWKWWSYTDTRSQCAALQNLVPFTTDKVYASSLVREILNRMKDGHWYNTQENIYCFEGLRRFVEKFEAENKDGELAVKLDGDEVKKSPTVKKSMRSITLADKEITASAKKVELAPKDKAQLYYSTFLRYETPYKERAPVDQGFNLDKKYFLKNGTKFTELKGNVMKLNKGDVVKVVLTVKTPAKRYQVMLNDRLAAAFEPINMGLANSSEAESAEAGTENDEPKNPWFDSQSFDYMDLRLNAAQFYAKKLDKGTHTLDYLLQVRVAGEFSLPEATVEEMYYPDIRGTFSGKKVIVSE